VAGNSQTEEPLIYKFSATWGNHEGSMLLWLLVLCAYGFVASRRASAYAVLVQTALSAGIILYILLTSNPFTRIFPVPVNGDDLNPLLQDVGLALHPPLLYLGYVGFSMVFSLAVGALLEKKLDAEWARTTQPWILAAWIPLTLGIGMGSWWAYRELGWG